MPFISDNYTLVDASTSMFGKFNKMSTIPEMFLSQVHNTREVDTPDQFPDVEAAQFNSSPSRSLSPGRRRALGFIIVIESFLAMVNILSGMMASEGKGWGLMFVWSVPRYRAIAFSRAHTIAAFFFSGSFYFLSGSFSTLE